MLPKPPACSGCPYEEVGGGFVKPDWMVAKATAFAGRKLTVWGEGGGEKEEVAGAGYVGPSGRMLRGCTARIGLDSWKMHPEVGQVFMNNVILCRPYGPLTGTSKSAYPGDAVVQECLRRHQREALMGTEPWLVTGANAIEAITGYRLSPLVARGSLLPVRNSKRWCTGTIHPAFLLRGGDRQAKAMSDMIPLLSLDARRAIESQAPFVPRTIVALPDRVLADFPADAQFLSIDIEGMDGPTIVGLSWQPDTVYVLDWSPATRDLINHLVHDKKCVPVLHNAAYDVPELQAVGVRMLRLWYDTINTAALINPNVKKGLQAQVLTYVLGSIVWKGIINHKAGPDSLKKTKSGDPRVYRALWSEVLTRLGRRVPANGGEWYRFYNGLDTGYTLALLLAHMRALKAQGRWDYYTKWMQPLQRPILIMGRNGMPADPLRIKWHRGACLRLERMAAKTVNAVARGTLQKQVSVAEDAVALLEAEREEEHARAGKRVAFSRGKELTSWRNKLKTRQAALAAGFNMDSFPQRKALLYDYYGLPPITVKKKVTTDDDAIEELLRRLTRTDKDGNPAPTAKPKTGTLEEVVSVLKAMAAGKKWATWRRNFLEPKLYEWPGSGATGDPARRSRIRTQYNLHRADTGRFSSGTDTSDAEKKRKVAQLQNVPEKLRDVVHADAGHVLVGADYAGIEWALVMFYASKVPSYIQQRYKVPAGYHMAMLEKFQAGEFDPHRYLAAFAFRVTEAQVTKKQRTLCKPYTHGRNYLGSPRTLGRQAGHTQSTGEHVCKAHAAAFMPQAWWEWEKQQVQKLGYVQSALGWRRYFWDKEPKMTEVLANRIQTPATGDLMKWVMCSMVGDAPAQGWDRIVLPDHPTWEFLTTTHDSVVLHVPQQDESEAKAYLQAKMQQPVPWLDNRTWRVDVKSGLTWRQA